MLTTRLHRVRLRFYGLLGFSDCCCAASTPWIALVSCDKNATDMSLDEDIFTLARDKGAVAAVCLSYTIHLTHQPTYLS